MSKRKAILWSCLGAWVFAPVLYAQSEPKSVPPSYPDKPPAPMRSEPLVLPEMTPDPSLDPKLLDGFWPTDHMIELFVQRAVQESGEKYQLQPEQIAQIQQDMTKRWKTFMRDNRIDIQPLMNEYAQANLAPKPPTAESVSDWAARATPVYSRVLSNLLQGEFEMRSALNAEQRAAFDQDRLERRKSLKQFQSRLRRWSVGQFEESEWWGNTPESLPDGLDPTGKWFAKAQPETDEDTAESRRVAIEQLPQRVKDEFHAWEAYVRNYCDQFELDQSQRNTAISMLREMLNRAYDHVYKRRDLIAKLEAKIANPVGVDQQHVEREMVELYGPLDSMFRELSARIERLPTNGQRSRALSQSKAKATPPQQMQDP